MRRKRSLRNISSKTQLTSGYQKALAALARMRRENLSLAEAIRMEGTKQSTFLQYVGDAVYRSGPNKPWRATKADELSAYMTVLTPQGLTRTLVRGSSERTRLAHYNVALRMWRAGEPGAERALRKFRGLTVGGHALVTDSDLLIELEEAGELDFDSLYSSIGGR